MSNVEVLKCPNCGQLLQCDFVNPELYKCDACNRSYNMVVNEKTSKAAFLEKKIEPLFLPQGSIRGIVTLLISFVYWIKLLSGQPEPLYLSGVLLAIIGYYFGFRRRTKEAQLHSFGQTLKVNNPLFLPNGVIRGFLMVGSLITALVVFWQRPGFMTTSFQFLVMLLAMMAGYLFRKMFIKNSQGKGAMLLNHVKGLVVLAALGVLVVSGFLPGSGAGNAAALWSALLITFYFGTRS